MVPGFDVDGLRFECKLWRGGRGTGGLDWISGRSRFESPPCID